MYLLGDVGGHRYQAALWNMRSKGRLALHKLTSEEADRMAILMEKYEDTPMDLADISGGGSGESFSSADFHY